MIKTQSFTRKMKNQTATNVKNLFVQKFTGQAIADSGANYQHKSVIL